MITMTFDLNKFTDKVDAMVKNLTDVQRKLPDTMMTWQTEDMKRKYPFLSESTPTQVATKVWPRSRVELRRRKKYSRKKISTRPILRPELEARLASRMRNMLTETLQWR